MPSLKLQSLIEEQTQVNLRQFESSYQAKRKRVRKIAKYRALYNVNPERMLRVRYDAPLPVFSGMMDTLLADLDDVVSIKFSQTDPADWRVCQKLTAAANTLSESQLPGGQWNDVFRQARKEGSFTGRGIMKYVPYSLDGKYHSNLSNVSFEHFIFDPRGGGNLENHLYSGQDDVWLSKSDLLEGVASGLYDKGTVDELLEMKSGNFNFRGSLDYEEEMRFRPLGVDPSMDVTGEPIFRFIEMISEKKGRRWYNLFEYTTGKSVRFIKYEEICSSELFPWFSFATHKDDLNFASKATADDLYPQAVSITDLFSEDMENRRLRNSNARAYDKDMFTNPQKLYEAQIGRSKLVPVDTKGGTRRISEGVYEFKTPDLGTGTINLIQWLEQDLGKLLGITELQQGAGQPATKKVGVTTIEMSNIGKRLSYMSQPVQEAVVQLGYRVMGGLKDYLKEPLSIKMFGENGYEWDTLKRVELNFKKFPEITVVSQNQTNKKNELEKANRKEALAMLSTSPNVNTRVRDEFIARDIGGYSETEISLLLDTTTQTTKDSVSLASAAIQDLMMGRVPPINYQADSYFLSRIIDFIETHPEDNKIKKNFNAFMKYIDKHKDIVMKNMERKGNEDRQKMMKGMPLEGQQPNAEAPQVEGVDLGLNQPATQTA